MSTETEICNRALGLIGHADIIDINDVNDQVAVKCKQHFVTQLNAVIRDHEWNCAKDRTSIAAAAATPAFGWDYSYALPVNCLRVLRLSDETEEWEREGRYILTDVEAPLEIHYLRVITNYSELDSDIVDAFEDRLGSRFATLFMHDDAKARALMQSYLLKIEQAKANDGQEGSAKQWTATGRYTTIRNY